MYMKYYVSDICNNLHNLKIQDIFIKSSTNTGWCHFVFIYTSVRRAPWQAASKFWGQFVHFADVTMQQWRICKQDNGSWFWEVVNQVLAWERSFTDCDAFLCSLQKTFCHPFLILQHAQIQIHASFQKPAEKLVHIRKQKKWQHKIR